MQPKPNRTIFRSQMRAISLLPVLLACVALHAHVDLVQADLNSLWPLPEKLTSGPQSNAITLFQNSFSFVLDPTCAGSTSQSALLPLAFNRYYPRVFWYAARSNDRDENDLIRTTSMKHRRMAQSTPTRDFLLVNLTVCVQTAEQNTPLALGVDESYALDVSATGARLFAVTVYGAMHGLETFSQLVEYNETAQDYQISYLPLSVVDAPRFAWRGLLIDSARHYLTLSAIYRTIDALEFNKMNVLHWHIVDAQSFPFQSTSYPNLVLGAYHPNAIYTHANVQSVITYAAQRGKGGTRRPYSQLARV